ncbi:uncharacterized protein LOC119381716 [Rhipicephalus sanguineus]|uniref:uncharacterized protein LOC119381716 n=1 Tax=Rhipicephalus sanguineus TaxID=34632 RepID=UPI0020C2397D|nr:uncharacterized protein LOC119381716 [Rhipicephalus sanguineus]
MHRHQRAEVPGVLRLRAQPVLALPGRLALLPRRRQPLRDEGRLQARLYLARLPEAPLQGGSLRFLLGARRPGVQRVVQQRPVPPHKVHPLPPGGQQVPQPRGVPAVLLQELLSNSEHCLAPPREGQCLSADLRYRFYFDNSTNQCLVHRGVCLKGRNRYRTLETCAEHFPLKSEDRLRCARTP